MFRIDAIADEIFDEIRNKEKGYDNYPGEVSNGFGSEGAIRQGFRLYIELTDPFAKAIFMMFICYHRGDYLEIMPPPYIFELWRSYNYSVLT